MRLEEEEDEAKAALMGRIQRLTKLILVSTKSSLQGKASIKPDHIWRHTFGEDEVSMLIQSWLRIPFHLGGTLIFVFLPFMSSVGVMFDFTP